MPTCYCLTLSHVFQLSVLSKLCIMNTLLHFLLLFQFCRSLRNISLRDCILGKSNVIITVGWLRWCHQRAPLFSLASGPPNPNSATGFGKHAHSRQRKATSTQTLPFHVKFMPCYASIYIVDFSTYGFAWSKIRNSSDSKKAEKLVKIYRFYRVEEDNQ